MSAYITATGVFLPGYPVPNDEIEDYIGKAGRASSDLKDLILANCGIKTRHYAIDKNQQTVISNAAMAAGAVRNAAERAGLGPNDVELLTAATTLPDRDGSRACQHGARRVGLWPARDRDRTRHLQLRDDGAEERVPAGGDRREAQRDLRRQRVRLTRVQEHPLRRDEADLGGRVVADGNRVPALHALRRRGRRGDRERARDIGDQPSHRLDLADVVREHRKGVHVLRQQRQRMREDLG